MTSERTAHLHRLFAGELEDTARALEDGLLALERVDPADHSRILDQLVRAAHTLKGSAGMVGAPAVAAICHGLEEDLAAMRAGHRGTADPKTVAEMLGRVDRLSSVWTPPASPAREPVEQPRHAEAGGSVRLPAAAIQSLVAGTADVQTAADRLADLPARVRSVRNELEQGRPDSASVAIAELERAVGPTVRGLLRAVHEVDRVARVAATVPLREACDGLARTVRDVAAAGAKRATLVLDVGEVGIDRQALATVRECLIHLVRNAVDHGLEPPEVRRGAGKPAEGRVTVTAEGVGDRVEVAVSDDGRGIDTTAVIAAAHAAGVEGATDPADLVFTPGLSTAEQLTDVSGRGVGLDVVRARTEQLGGTVDLSSTAGVGTTVTVALPARLSTARVVVVEVAGDPVALLTAGVRHLMRVHRRDVITAAGQQLLRTADGTVRVAWLSDLLGLPHAPPNLTDDGHPAVVVGSDDEAIAVLVDDVRAERDTVIVPMRGLVASIPAVVRAALLPAGEAALVCHPAALGRQARETLPAVPLAVDETGSPRILLVDDAPTTRALEGGILETAGYEVLLAGDGRDAWERLQHEEVDLVVSDVAMPRMDGIELCREIRRSPRLRHLPVVLVTSLGSEQDRQRGADAGANAYIVKAGFEQHRLLQTIAGLL